MKTRDGSNADALGRRMPHPAVLIFVWAGVTLIVQMLSAGALLLLAGSLIVFALGVSTLRFLFLLRRTRWILFSLFVIYAYASQGTPLWTSLGAFSPMAEGVQDGAVLLLRLLAVLAVLSILLRLLSRTQLVAGLYMLMCPLDLLGISRERIAVRLALTLHYAESSLVDKNRDWYGHVEELLSPPAQMPGGIELQSAALSMYDGLVMAAAVLAIAGLCL